MKYLIPLFALLLVVSCKTKEIVQYKYTSTTMIGSKTLTVTKDSVTTEFNSRGKKSYEARATLAGEWEELKAASAKVDLNKLSELEAPTNRRQSDAAPFGTLFLSTKDSTYNSNSFDGYNAHESLLPLMGVIEKIANTARPKS